MDLLHIILCVIPLLLCFPNCGISFLTLQGIYSCPSFLKYWSFKTGLNKLYKGDSKWKKKDMLWHTFMQTVAHFFIVLVTMTCIEVLK
jgi:hypothetical protein